MRTKKFKDFISDSDTSTSPDYLAGIKTTSGVTETVKHVPMNGGNSLYAGTASGTDTYTATISGIAAYTANLSVRVTFTNSNTGASTININSLGAKPLVKFGNAALNAGDIKAGQILDLVYDGTNFQIPSVTSNIVDAV